MEVDTGYHHMYSVSLHFRTSKPEEEKIQCPYKSLTSKAKQNETKYLKS